MYATLETYDLHDVQCPLRKQVKEGFELKEKDKKNKKQLFVDSPDARRKRRGGKGVDNDLSYDPFLPYMYMFDPRHFNKFPYGQDYKVVDGEEDGKQYLNVYSYPSTGSSTRVMYCDAPPKLWEFCDDDF